MEETKFRPKIMTKIKQKLEKDLLHNNNVNLSNVIESIKNCHPKLFPHSPEAFINKLKFAVQSQFWGNTLKICLEKYDVQKRFFYEPPRA